MLKFGFGVPYPLNQKRLGLEPKFPDHSEHKAVGWYDLCYHIVIDTHEILTAQSPIRDVANFKCPLLIIAKVQLRLRITFFFTRRSLQKVFAGKNLVTAQTQLRFTVNNRGSLELATSAIKIKMLLPQQFMVVQCLHCMATMKSSAW